MCSESAIAVEVSELSKAYRIYSDPQERLKRAIVNRISPFARNADKLFWALQQVSFDIKRGESVGIVGRNGAGKSTLLQLLCGTVQPTEGHCQLHGSVAALLELGSGFNLEFTGIENIFLYGQILGISQKQIRLKLDEILDFADIGDFSERPVKTYSSGMVVRLAFAVSVSRAPDILIVDEALAVGDEAFKRKCFARIDQLRANGTTILFVSHSANLVAELCTRILILEEGQLIYSGDPKIGLSWYTKLIFATSRTRTAVKQDILALQFKDNDARASTTNGRKEGSGEERPYNPAYEVLPFYSTDLISVSRVEYEACGARIHNEHIQTLTGKKVNVLVPGETYEYRYLVKFESAAQGVGFGMMVKSITGSDIGGGVNPSWQKYYPEIPAGLTYQVCFKFRCLLNPGAYFMNAGVQGTSAEHQGTTYLHRILDALMFKVLAVGDQVATGTVNLDISSEVSISEEN